MYHLWSLPLYTTIAWISTSFTLSTCMKVTAVSLCVCIIICTCLCSDTSCYLVHLYVKHAVCSASIHFLCTYATTKVLDSCISLIMLCSRDLPSMATFDNYLLTEVTAHVLDKHTRKHAKLYNIRNSFTKGDCLQLTFRFYG